MNRGENFHERGYEGRHQPGAGGGRSFNNDIGEGSVVLGGSFFILLSHLFSSVPVVCVRVQKKKLAAAGFSRGWKEPVA